jgi:hypothetical protein
MQLLVSVVDDVQLRKLMADALLLRRTIWRWLGLRWC